MKCRLINVVSAPKGKLTAQLVSERGELVISGEVDYIIQQVKVHEYRLIGDRVPHTKSQYELPSKEHIQIA